MKDLKEKIIPLLKEGHCTPQIAQLARKLHEPATTIHYNIKKLEKEGTVKTYKAVFDYKQINQGYCVYILVNVSQEKYGDPEDIAKRVAKEPLVESIEIVTGDYELIIKLRCKDIDEYYLFVKRVIKQYGFSKVVSMTSLKEFKQEFVLLEK